MGYSPWGRKQLDTAEHTCTQGNRMHHIFCLLYLFSFEIIVGSHEVVRNNTERLCVSFIQFHPAVASCIIMMDLGFRGGSNGIDSAHQCRRPGFNPWVGKTPPEKGMATHSNILALSIPWTVEPVGLQFMGS